MSVRIETLAELKSIRFDKNETVFCVQNGREYYLELDGGSFTPDDIDFVQAIHSRNAMYIAISGSTAGNSSTIASQADAEAGIENTKPMSALRTKQAVTAYGELSANKGQANGYPSLDSSSRIPLAQLPTSVQTLKGNWNASTNTPTLADGTGTSGDTYRVSVAATRNLGSGNISFGVDDRVVYNGTTWEKWDTNDAVTSVHGRTGSVTAQAGDYAAFYAEKASGIVLQEVTAIDAGNFTANGSLTNVNVANVSITPKSASSIIIVDVQFQAVSPLLSVTNTIAHYRLYETTASADIGAEIEHTGAAENQGVRLAASANIRARLTNSATSARTFQLRARTSHAGAPAYATSMVWSIREIAA